VGGGQSHPDVKRVGEKRGISGGVVTFQKKSTYQERGKRLRSRTWGLESHWRRENVKQNPVSLTDEKGGGRPSEISFRNSKSIKSPQPSTSVKRGGRKMEWGLGQGQKSTGKNQEERVSNHPTKYFGKKKKPKGWFLFFRRKRQQGKKKGVVQGGRGATYFAKKGGDYHRESRGIQTREIIGKKKNFGRDAKYEFEIMGRGGIRLLRKCLLTRLGFTRPKGAKAPSHWALWGGKRP